MASFKLRRFWVFVGLLLFSRGIISSITGYGTDGLVGTMASMVTLIVGAALITQFSISE